MHQRHATVFDNVTRLCSTGCVYRKLYPRRDRKRWRLRQQRCLEAASRPAMLAQSMRRVGLIDIMVGNAARLGASQRSTTRRCASHHIATQRASRWGHPGGFRAFSAYGRVCTLSGLVERRIG